MTSHEKGPVSPYQGIVNSYVESLMDRDDVAAFVSGLSAEQKDEFERIQLGHTHDMLEKKMKIEEGKSLVKGDVDEATIRAKVLGRDFLNYLKGYNDAQAQGEQ